MAQIKYSSFQCLIKIFFCYFLSYQRILNYIMLLIQFDSMNNLQSQNNRLNTNNQMNSPQAQFKQDNQKKDQLVQALPQVKEINNNNKQKFQHKQVNIDDKYKIKEIKLLKYKLEEAERKISDYTYQYNKLIEHYQKVQIQIENIDKENIELKEKILSYYVPKMDSMKLSLVKQQQNQQKEILIEDQIAQLQEQIQKQKKNHEQTLRLRQLLHYNAIKNKHSQRYKQALGLLNQELPLCFKLKQAQTIVHAEVLFQLAQNHRLSKSYQSSLNLYLQALAIFKKENSQSNQVARTLNGIGLVYYFEGKESDKALDYYQQALRINKKAVGEVHEDVAINFNNIAKVYKDRQEYWEAINKYSSALDVYQKLKKEQLNYDSAFVYFNLAECNFKVNQFEEGIRLYYEGFTIIKILKMWSIAESRQRITNFKEDLTLLLSIQKISTYLVNRCIKIIEEIFGQQIQDQQIMNLKQILYQKLEV